ncbi:unnamed protein product [Ceutorhynchus assimilis]|uniref:Endonuclease/exonuclease/phosphatase domain-containing protein n=1 Tax=Ceutorhynchus assimilis TaxID=467358 RepID=A0A9N9QHE3_9CUCU|nr:unnamed protein product [Ceutorhynchus assimilis]
MVLRLKSKLEQSDTYIKYDLTPSQRTYLKTVISELETRKAEASINKINPTIVLITESWLRTDLPDSFVHLPDYILFRLDRHNQTGGDICIFVKNTVAEAVWLEITISTFTFVTACIYRLKSSTPEQNKEFTATVVKALESKIPTFLFGDFNYTEINWDKLTVYPHNQCSEDFFNSYQIANAHQDKYKRTKTNTDYDHHKQQNNITKQILNQARQEYEQNLLQAPVKKFHSYIKHSLNSRLQNFAFRNTNTNQTTYDETEIGNCFADQFQRVFTQEDKKLPTLSPELRIAQR